MISEFDAKHQTHKAAQVRLQRTWQEIPAEFLQLFSWWQPKFAYSELDKKSLWDFLYHRDMHSMSTWIAETALPPLLYHKSRINTRKIRVLALIFTNIFPGKEEAETSCFAWSYRAIFLINMYAVFILNTCFIQIKRKTCTQFVKLRTGQHPLLQSICIHF